MNALLPLTGLTLLVLVPSAPAQILLGGTPNPSYPSFHAWYDAASGELVIRAQPDGYGPVARSEIIHETVHALTDQHYGWSDDLNALIDMGADDRLEDGDAGPREGRRVG